MSGCRKFAADTKDAWDVDIDVFEADKNVNASESEFTMSNIHDNRGASTRSVSFRISESIHRKFIDLLGSVPGSDAGSMYREIFSRGLKSLTDFYSQQGIAGNGSSDAKEGA